ncbi:uncharacterized protein LOC129750735 [Uranotaenia lowii]|uniref:uncharacterized protein LOC129750735 n=1 Tax=Uranotaenia lowii TaxID=190385 RepID=UPI00247AC871|nr:uncharacterized protein LOC129750735 [Uranotaenia lowii]
MTYVSEKSFMWQKIAVEIELSDSQEEIIQSIRNGANILYIRFGRHNLQENLTLLHLAKQALLEYSFEISPFKPVIGIACELSGKWSRLKCHRHQRPIQLQLNQRILLTCDKAYEDKQADNVMFVTNLDQRMKQLKTGDLITISQITLKICKLKGKFISCFVKHLPDNGIDFQVTNYERVNFYGTNSCDVNDIDLIECNLLLENNIEYIVVPDIDNEQYVLSIIEMINGSEQSSEISPIILGSLSPAADDKTVENLTALINGIVTDRENIVDLYRKACKVIIFNITDFEKFAENILHTVDVYLTKSSLQNSLKTKLKTFNQASISTFKTGNKLNATCTAISKCIEYTSISIKANAIILYITKSNCEAEWLSRKPLPCPVLIATSDRRIIQTLLLRKYCFPIHLPGTILSHRMIIKYVTIYGRKFGYLCPGNITITGFGEKDIQGVELRYVPDDFITLCQ